jgi:hypothetical protein
MAAICADPSACNWLVVKVEVLAAGRLEICDAVNAEICFVLSEAKVSALIWVLDKVLSAVVVRLCNCELVKELI